MKRLLFFLLGITLGSLPATTARAGPNEGGILLVHVNESLEYSAGFDFCGHAGLESCEAANTRVDTMDEIVVSVLAAFPGDGFPRLAGLNFAIDYDDTKIVVDDWGNCGDFSLPQAAWPAPRSGISITWSEAQTGYLTEVLWLAVHAQSTDPATFGPIAEGPFRYFADDDVPSYLDEIADFGALGFYADGTLPCPVPPPANAMLELVPSEIAVYQSCGGSFPIDLRVTDVYSLAAFEVCVGYADAALAVEDVAIDPELLGSTGRDVYPVAPVACDPVCQSSGIRFGAFTVGSSPPASGNGRLATLRFSPVGAAGGIDLLCLDSWELTNDAIPADVIPVHASGLTITHSPYCFGDFDGSGDVTAFDLSQIIPRWRCCVGDGCYDPRFDVNVLERGGYCASSPDGCTDVVDIQTVAGRWHHGCPGTAPAEDAAAFELAPSVSVSPAQADVVAEVGDTTSVALIVTDVTDLGAFQIGLSFDPGVVTVESVHTGALLGSTGRTVYNLSTQIDNGTGVVHFGACTIDNGPAAAGSGVLARVVFRVEDCEGVTDLALSDVILTYADGWPQALGGSADGTMSIHCASTDVPVATDAITFALEPNRPNPLSSSTTITFSLPSGTGGEPTRLAIFDAGGRLIRTLVDGVLDPGRHRVEWDSRDASGTPAPSGTYFCRLTLGGTSLNRPLQLIR